MKLAIIDLDGVVADNTERFKQAEDAKQAFIAEKTEANIARFHRTGIGWAEETVNKQAESLYWQTAFTPELVSLDTLIEDAKEAMYDLERADMGSYKIIFLTSRPESMREATEHWLSEQGVKCMFNSNHFPKRELIMKAPAFQFVKTPAWKAGMVQTLAILFGAEIVKFVDDEEANWNELLKHTPYVRYSLEWCKDLQEAVETLKEE